MTELSSRAPSLVVAPSCWAMPALVADLALAPDGGHVWVSDRLGNIRLLSLATGLVKRSLRAPREPKASGGGAIALDPTGSYLAFAPENAPAELWDLARGEQVALDAVGAAFCVVFSDDGALLLVGGAKVVALWDLRARGGPRRTKLAAHRSQVFAAAFCGDGSGALTVSPDEVKKQDFRTRKASPVHANGAWYAGRARLDRGATKLVGKDGGALLVWDLARGREHVRVPITSAVPHHAVLCSIERDGSAAYLYDHWGQRLLRVAIPAEPDAPSAGLTALPLGWIVASVVRTLPDGTLLVGGTSTDVMQGAGVLAVLDPSSGAVLRGPAPGAAFTNAVHARGDTVWVASADRTLAERDARDGSIRRVHRVEGCSFDALYADASGSPAFARARSSVGRRAKTYRLADEAVAHDVGESDAFPPRSAVHAPSRTLFRVAESQVLAAVSLDDGAERARFDRVTGAIDDVLVSADGSRVAVAGMDDVWVFDALAGGAPLVMIRATPRGRPGTSLLTRDGRSLVTAGTKGSFVVWDTGKGRKVRTLKPETPDADPLLRAACAALDPTERWLFTGHVRLGTGEVWGWDLASGGRRVRYSTGTCGYPTALSVTEGAGTVVAGTSSGAVLSWHSHER